MSYPFTWYRRDTASRRGLRLVMDRDEIAHAMADAGSHADPKRDLPLLCTATFKGDHRGNDRVESVHMLGLDLDVPVTDPAETIATVAETLGNVEVHAYSTISSEPGAYKLRALVPYDRGATGDEHRASWALVARMLARADVIVDKQCSDPARGFYLWAVPPSGAYYHARLDGHPWPVALAAEVEVERLAEEKSARAREVSQRRAQRPGVGLSNVERARRYVERMPAAIAGSGGHASTFAVARRLVADFELPDAEAWEVLAEYNERCQPQWNERDLRHKMASAKKARVRVDMVSR